MSAEQLEELSKVFQNPETILQFTSPSPPTSNSLPLSNSSRTRNPRRNGPKSNVTMTTVSMIPPAKKTRLEDIFPSVDSLQDTKLDLSLFDSSEGMDKSELKNSSVGGVPPQHYTCHQCQKIFWSETSLKHHCSLYHSEKAFVCEICGKAFRFRSNLAEHRSVHTSLKPYVCKFCGKSSRLKGNLTKHILKHHKKEQNAFIGKDDIIIKKGKKSVKDPAAVDFLEKSMIVISNDSSPPTTVPSAAMHLYTMAQIANNGTSTSTPHDTSASSLDLSSLKGEGLSGLAGSLLLGGDCQESIPSGRESSGSEFQGLVMDTQCENGDASSPDPEMMPVESSENLNGDPVLESSERDTPSTDYLDGTVQQLGPSASSNTRCSLCGKHFRKAGSLRIHMTVKHGQPPPDSSGVPPNGCYSDSAYSSSATNRASPRSVASSSIGIASPPPLKVGNHYALVNGNHQHRKTPDVSSAPMTSSMPAMTSSSDVTSRAMSSHMTTTVTPTPSSLLSSDIRELKEVLRDIRTASREGGGASVGGVSNQLISARLETLLLSLDTRVGRLEKQVESSVNSLYSLVQLQSSMNTAFSRFREDISVQLKSLQNLVALASSSINSAANGGSA